MEISYNWLKEYISLEETPSELAEILTSLGLEVEGFEEVESIKGGLKGVVIGQVLECKPHPNSDHLHLTKVDVGTGELLDIVCGAPNVAAGQKVVVATVGTKLYSGDKEFEIKKAKIRGENSYGMICAEDEIGIGTSHDGIMVLPETATVGMPAAEYFGLTSDWFFSIGLTPNRVDAASHIGVARDLAAYFSIRNPRTVKMPDISTFSVDQKKNPVIVEVVDIDGCYRYAGLTIEGITVQESPKWLKDRLTTLGMKPINNVVDVTNYVLHELGQPLHAFDLDKVAGNKVIIKSLPSQTQFVTLDGVERQLDATDLMICNAEEGMCMAGILGGLDSGVTENTTRLFLESAWFNPVRIRKTARRHGLSTDASFRFERGTDPNMVIIALKRAALLIKQVAGGNITSDIYDVVNKSIENFPIDFDLRSFYTFAGENIAPEKIEKILEALEIKIEKTSAERWKLSVPPYRVDVQRQADISEEILRIYGYNNIPIPERITMSVPTSPKPNPELLQDKISTMLVAAGYVEMMNNSISKTSYYDNNQWFDRKQLVCIMNPLSSDLNCMRMTLFFGALETLQRNKNRQRQNMKFFEFGKTYWLKKPEKSNELKSYAEAYKLALIATGNRNDENWNEPERAISFFDIKAIVENIFRQMGVNLQRTVVESIENEYCLEGLRYVYNANELAQIWTVRSQTAKGFDLSLPIFYAELNWETLLAIAASNSILFKEMPKFPWVRRDLALLVDNQITFNQLKEVAYRTERNILKDVGLFDVYTGDKIDAGKKSYALYFILQDENATLTDQQIDKTMERLVAAFDREFGAKLR
ncbi:MAG TPA: phenylalanine--tRNA ligase subunit beta [Salinivirgaceae bacterium]|nr:phenylalanine--tRNA ligase subunit beta [Salinivirgaceae bacterium]